MKIAVFVGGEYGFTGGKDKGSRRYVSGLQPASVDAKVGFEEDEFDVMGREREGWVTEPTVTFTSSPETVITGTCFS